MAFFVGYTLGALLCGNVPSLSAATIRSIITPNSGVYNNRFLSDITSSPDNFISSQYNTQYIRDTDPSFSTTYGVYLSASSVLFDDINSSSPAYTGDGFYIYNYIDTGTISDSNIISYQSSITPVQGPTSYTINDEKLFFFKDTGDETRYTYRYFNERLVTDQVGNLNNNTVGAALLSTSYALDINHTSYSDISGHVIATVTIPTFVDHTSNTGSLKSKTSFNQAIPLSAGTVGSVVFYLSSVDAPLDRTLICGISGASVQYTTTVDIPVYLKLYQNTIMTIGS